MRVGWLWLRMAAIERSTCNRRRRERGASLRRREERLSGKRTTPIPLSHREQNKMLVEREEQVEVVGKLGEGTFSVVEKGKVKGDEGGGGGGGGGGGSFGGGKERFVALKRIHPNSSPRRILGELQCLRLLSGKPNLARLCGAYREPQRFTIVVEYFAHDKFKSYLNTIGGSGLRAYMRGLFTALEHAHECGEWCLREREIKGRGRGWGGREREREREREIAESDDSTLPPLVSTLVTQVLFIAT